MFWVVPDISWDHYERLCLKWRWYTLSVWMWAGSRATEQNHSVVIIGLALTYCNILSHPPSLPHSINLGQTGKLVVSMKCPLLLSSSAISPPLPPTLQYNVYCQVISNLIIIFWGECFTSYHHVSVCISLYWNSLQCGFVFDDISAIRDNRWEEISKGWQQFTDNNTLTL